jgi:collagenase-like PrtC family protease
MRLIVATNWDDDLLPAFAELGVHAVFGKLQNDLVGGGRPSCILPPVDWARMEAHIALAHRLGIRFLYLWNVGTVADAEYHHEFVHDMEAQLRRLVHAGIDGLVVGLPWMIPLAKDISPALEVSVSSFVHVDSPREARQFQTMGADTIILHQTGNRDFRRLLEIRAAVECDLELIANNSCIYQCPYVCAHQTSPAFHSRTGSRPVLEYELFWCAGRYAHDGAELIRSRWIRPEDLAVYESMGYDRFKIAGRGRDSQWLLRAVRAYAARSHQGDLTEIISMSQHAPLALAKRRAEEGWPHSDAWARIAADLAQVGDLRIRNADIPADFLDFFRTHDCNTMSCRSCRYCEVVARRAVGGATRFEADALPAMPRADMFEDLLLDRAPAQRLEGAAAEGRGEGGR